MSVKRSSVEFQTLKFSQADLLEKLDPSEAVFLSLTTFLVGEINVLSRLYLSSAHDFEDEFLLDWAAISQRAVVMRIWSAKLYEFIDLLWQEEKSKKQRPDWLRAHIAEGNKRVNELRKGKAWEVVSALRNEVTYHLKEKPVKKNLKHINQGADLNFYVNERDRNSIFPLGEEVVFNARLNRNSNKGGSLQERSITLSAWGDWNNEATKFAVDFQWMLVKKLVMPLQVEGPLETVKLSMDADKIGDVTKQKVPLFDRS